MRGRGEWYCRCRPPPPVHIRPPAPLFMLSERHGRVCRLCLHTRKAGAHCGCATWVQGDAGRGRRRGGGGNGRASTPAAPVSGRGTLLPEHAPAKGGTWTPPPSPRWSTLAKSPRYLYAAAVATATAVAAAAPTKGSVGWRTSLRRRPPPRALGVTPPPADTADVAACAVAAAPTPWLQENNVPSSCQSLPQAPRARSATHRFPSAAPPSTPRGHETATDLTAPVHIGGTDTVARTAPARTPGSRAAANAMTRAARCKGKAMGNGCGSGGAPRRHDPARLSGRRRRLIGHRARPAAALARMPGAKGEPRRCVRWRHPSRRMQRCVSGDPPLGSLDRTAAWKRRLGAAADTTSLRATQPRTDH